VKPPWLRHYDPGVPETLAPYPETTLLDVFAETLRARPGHSALLFKGTRVSCAELDALSSAFAAALVADGIRPGDRVALLLPNCPQFLIAELGAWKAGATVVPLNPMYGEGELRHPLAATGARTIVTLSLFYDRVRRVAPQTALERVISTSIKTFLPAHLRFLFTLFKERQGHRVLLARGDRTLEALLGQYAGQAAPGTPPDPDSPALILLSGGTTGTPKGVVAPHRALVITGMQLRAWCQGGAREWDDAILLPLPLFHAFGCIATQATAFLGRHPLALVPNPRDIPDMIATIRRVRPAFFVGVPTLYNALLNHPLVRRGGADFRSVRICISGAAPLLAETRKRFEALSGGRLVEGYSMTEALIAAVVNPLQGGGRPGAVGIPLPDVEVRIVDADSGTRELAADQVGEIILRAPQIMPGYFGEAEETALALRSHDGATWLYTGDLGRLDEDGFLFLVDRKKDLIKISGLQVWPREIEEAVAAHPAVAEVGVAGVPDADKGEVAKAWVVLRPGHSLALDELRAFCRARLAPFKVPAQMEIRAELPKSLVGKVLRRVLVEEERRTGAGRGAMPA
jgi:long-chain acyl-CoA synthetase